MKDIENKLKSASRTSRKHSLSLRSPGTKSFLINLDDIAEPHLVIPPDGGWGWVIVGSSTFIMFCIDGLGYCCSLFFEEIRHDLNCEFTEIAIVSSLIGGFYYLAGPITCSALNRLGFQLIAVIGGILAVIAFTAASFVRSLPPFLILMGVFGGTAFNFIYTPSVIAIGFYFEKWRAVAMAICCSGSSLGVMCFPIIIVNVLGDLHWRTKFKIVAGIFAVCGLLGLTFRPLKTTKLEKVVQFGQVSRIASDVFSDDETEFKDLGGLAKIFQRFRNALFPTISEVSISMEVDKVASKTSSVGFNYFVRGLWCSNCWRFTHCSPCCTKKSVELSFSNINRPLYRDDIFYGGSVYTLPQYQRHAESHVSVSKPIPSLAYTLSVSRAATQRDLEQQNQCVCCPEAVLRVLATMLDFQMLKSPAFLILLFSGYLSLMGTYIVFTYLPSYAIEKGIDTDLASMLLSVIGVSNVLGRVACGGVSCLPVLDVTLLSWVTISISGFAVIFTFLAFSFTDHIITYAIFGFSIASFAVLRPLIFVDLFGLENLTNCFGLNMVFQSLAAFSATPIANLILRYTGSYEMVFIFTGVSVAVSGLILIPVKCILRWERRHRRRVMFT